MNDIEQGNDQNTFLQLSRLSEVWNGRLAMVGFAIVAVDILTGNGILHLWGLM